MRRQQTRMGRRSLLSAASIGALGAAFGGARLSAAGRTAAEEANVKVVNDFCAAWKTGDANKAGAQLADNCVVRFIASQDDAPTFKSRAATVEQIAKYLSGNKIEFMVHDTYVSGPVVMNRRVDRLVNEKGTRDINVIGVFFVRGGKIKEWADFVPDPM